MSEITLERLEKAFIAADDAGESEDAAEFAKAIRGMQALQGSQGLPASTTGGAIAAGGLDGMTFGFGDEAAAGGIAAFESVFGTKGFDETYGAALEMARKLRAQDKEQNPVASYGSEALGGVATAVATGGLGLAAKGTTTAAKAGLGAAEGAGYGALYGFGSGEGRLLLAALLAAAWAVLRRRQEPSSAKLSPTIGPIGWLKLLAHPRMQAECWPVQSRQKAPKTLSIASKWAARTQCWWMAARLW